MDLHCKWWSHSRATRSILSSKLWYHLTVQLTPHIASSSILVQLFCRTFLLYDMRSFSICPEIRKRILVLPFSTLKPWNFTPIVRSTPYHIVLAYLLTWRATTTTSAIQGGNVVLSAVPWNRVVDLHIFPMWAQIPMWSQLLIAEDWSVPEVILRTLGDDRILRTGGCEHSNAVVHRFEK